MAMSRQAAICRNEIADELLANVLPDRAITWTAASLGVDQSEFTRIADRIFELEGSGAVDVVSLGRGRTDNGLHVTSIRFMRLEDT